MGDPSTIEGFDDDVSADSLGREMTLPGGEEEEADAEFPPGAGAGGRSDGAWSRGVTPEASRLEEDLRIAREEDIRLKEENERLQARLLANRKTHKVAGPGVDAATGLMDNSRFAAAVENWWVLDNTLADAR